MLYLLWLIKVRPFDTLILNVTEIIIEFAIFMVSVNYIIYYFDSDDNDEIRGKVIIGFCMVAILAGGVSIIVSVTRTIKEWFTKKKENTKVAPIEDDDLSEKPQPSPRGN